MGECVQIYSILKVTRDSKLYYHVLHVKPLYIYAKTENALETGLIYFESRKGGQVGKVCLSRLGAWAYSMLMLLYCCFTSTVNILGHVGTVS